MVSICYKDRHPWVCSRFVQNQTRPPLVWPPVRPSNLIPCPVRFASARTVVAAPLPIVAALNAVLGRYSACMFLQTHKAVRNRNPKLHVRNPCLLERLPYPTRSFS